MSNIEKTLAFFNLTDKNGETNLEKIRRNQKIIRRVESTGKDKSYESAEGGAEFHNGAVFEDGKLIGFGIHIFNEDIYPLKWFEIYLRSCGLTGELNLSRCEDMVFLDVYHNEISGVITGYLPSMRIFGVQDNQLKSLDSTGMPACQGIDAGKNRLKTIDVSKNPELVELYINDNDFTSVDLSANGKLKYFYCHNNRITRLDTRMNPLLRHLNAFGNPMKTILSLAPQRDGAFPLELRAGEGGCVGLKFNPVYNAQWKETGEWQQSYSAVPDEGFRFKGWFDENGELLSTEELWVDEYGASRILTAGFIRV